MIASASVAGVSGPKFMVPRHRRLTERPERPRWMYSILLSLPWPRGFTRPMPGYPFPGTAASRAVTAGGAPAGVHGGFAAPRRSAEPPGGRRAVGRQERDGQAGGGEETSGPGRVPVR